MFASNGRDLRGRKGQRAGKVWLGRLGGPGCRSREERGEAFIESIRWALETRESERPIVAEKRGNARGAKGPWQEEADSKGPGTDWTGKACPITERTPGQASDAQRERQTPVREGDLQKPDAGNLHVRFDEGEGGRRSLALRLSSRDPFSTLPVKTCLGNPRLLEADSRAAAVGVEAFDLAELLDRFDRFPKRVSIEAHDARATLEHVRHQSGETLSRAAGG